MTTNQTKKYFECTCYGHGLILEKDEDQLFWITKSCRGTKGEQLPFWTRVKFAFKFIRGDSDVSFDEVILNEETAYAFGREIIFQYLRPGEYVTISKGHNE